jgi:hypothetical protein
MKDFVAIVAIELGLLAMLGGIVGAGLIVGNVAARIAHLEWWAEHAVGCWPDGCHFDK